MHWQRTWDWANAVVFDVETKTLEFRSSIFGLMTMRAVNRPVEECRVRYQSVADYYGESYR